jgi:uncharacterized protein
MSEHPDFELARQYAMQRLQHELSPKVEYHSINHTNDEVVPAAEKIALMEGVNEEELLLVRTAALYHDIGFVHESKEHEAIGASIAGETLPGFGYSQGQVKEIQGMILATRLPQSPRTLLEQIMADADLDILGREDFLARNQALRNELANQGREFSDEQWYQNQLNFLKNHHYWTEAARKLREANKQANIKALEQLLEHCRTNS